MGRRSIDAFSAPEKVAAYDADMDLMHPNRSRMVEIAIEVLPFEPGAALTALDLGAGTGHFTAMFLEAYPRAKVVAVDGAEAMLDLAKTRLGDRAAGVEFVTGDFRDLRSLVTVTDGFDVAYSSYALHHLDPPEKTVLVRDVLSLLRPAGWFVNADIIVAEAPAVEARFQQLRVDGIVRRAGGADERFVDQEAARRYLNEMEARDGDQPVTLAVELRVLRDGGLRDVAVFWLEYREAVTGGRR
jgi:ubiquinone/menaquinone biosynthesis C-methylase UbiE